MIGWALTSSTISIMGKSTSSSASPFWKMVIGTVKTGNEWNTKLISKERLWTRGWEFLFNFFLGKLGNGSSSATTTVVRSSWGEVDTAAHAKFGTGSVLEDLKSVWTWSKVSRKLPGSWRRHLEHQHHQRYLEHARQRLECGWQRPGCSGWGGRRTFLWHHRQCYRSWGWRCIE